MGRAMGKKPSLHGPLRQKRSDVAGTDNALNNIPFFEDCTGTS